MLTAGMQPALLPKLGMTTNVKTFSEQLLKPSYPPVLDPKLFLSKLMLVFFQNRPRMQSHLFQKYVLNKVHVWR